MATNYASTRPKQLFPPVSTHSSSYMYTENPENEPQRLVKETKDALTTTQKKKHVTRVE
jgi:hypothetical protein